LVDLVDLADFAASRRRADPRAGASCVAGGVSPATGAAITARRQLPAQAQAVFGGRAELRLLEAELADDLQPARDRRPLSGSVE
jgi:hypothetical protein